jgi:hypothetical protein
MGAVDIVQVVTDADNLCMGKIRDQGNGLFRDNSRIASGKYGMNM